MQIVWFKRDLRAEDNAALHNAAKSGEPVIPLYILEPELWQQPDMSHRHYAFLLECLKELDIALRKLGQPLIVKVGAALEVLEEISQNTKITALWSHQETWNSWTYKRDIEVAKWCKAKVIPWHEPVQNGVVRRLKSRDGWAQNWQSLMSQSILKAPSKLIPIKLTSDQLPSAEALGLAYDHCSMRQNGGRSWALKLLRSFLYQRGEGYSKEMSSPVTAYDSCSRISPHLAFGTISMREVFNATQKREQELQYQPNPGKWLGSLRSFSARLHWHCHFIQKLESQPDIEFTNFHHDYDNLRPKECNEEFLRRWKNGTTGYPIIDACMRALIATGWLNFRMRAMLISFASYHLWLDWRETSLYLARLFTDYEPGIHYSQVQMQSGTTGINAVRIYNPIKQSIDHDPNGVFIKKWVPELENMPISMIHTPWLMPDLIGAYPTPLVDESIARKQAAQKIYSVRKSLEHKEQAHSIVEKHGSRKSGLAQIRSKKSNPKQIALPLFE